MTTNFERVKAMLDILVGQISGDAQTRMKTATRSLTTSYGRLMNSGVPPIDYTDSAVQAAYVYTYVGANADLIYRSLIVAGKPARDACAKQIVKIVSIGGGPGTELLGIFKFLERIGARSTPLVVTILDHFCAEWRPVQDAVLKTRPSGTDCSIAHAPFSFHSAALAADLSSVAEADIVFMSYCLSEAWRYDVHGIVSKRVGDIITALRPGALLCYSDNGGPHFNSRAETAFDRVDLNRLDRSEYTQMVGNDEESSVLNDYRDYLGGARAKLRGSATCIVMRKL